MKKKLMKKIYDKENKNKVKNKGLYNINKRFFLFKRKN
jgi:hypothetical protein